MSTPIAKYQIKVDSELGLVITPYAYTKFWTEHIQICHECGSIKFSPIDTRASKNGSDWPKLITVPLNRCIVFNMKGDE